MGRLARRRNAGIDVMERLAHMPAIEVEGKVRVRLHDPDTGRVKHEQRADNFVAIPALEYMKFWPKFALGRMGNAATGFGTIIADAYGFRPDAAPFNPLHNIACWEDASAEDSATETRVNGRVTAWASRHQMAAPGTSLRGNVVPSACEWTPTYSKWLFYWDPTQGNLGSFQSIGWTTIEPTVHMPQWPIGADSTTANMAAFTLANPNIANVSGTAAYWDGTNWFLFDGPSGTPAWKTFGATGGASTGTVFTLSNTQWSNAATTTIQGACKIGTDWFFSGRHGTAGAQVQKVNSSGTNQWVANPLGVTAFFNDITTDGTNLWVGCSDGNIYRINTSTGAIAATITPVLPNGLTVSTGNAAGFGVRGIAYDSADGHLWVLVRNTAYTQGGILYKVNATTGAIVSSPQLNVGVGANSINPETGQLPNATIQLPQSFQQGPVAWGENTTTAYFGSTTTKTPGGNAAQYIQTLGQALNFKGSDLWMGIPLVGSVTLDRIVRASGAGVRNLGTRALLGSPITKTSSYAMSVQYQFNY